MQRQTPLAELCRYLKESEFSSQTRDRVKALIETIAKQPDGISALNSQDEKGVSVIHWAALHGDYPLFKLLIDNGANPYIKSHLGFDALVYLSRGLIPLIRAKKYSEMQTLLQAEKLDLTNKDKNGVSAGLLICAHLTKCIKENDTEGFKYIKLHLPEKYFQTIIHMKDLNASTLLHHAARAGRLEIMDLLLAAGADMRVKNKNNSDILDDFTECVISLIRSQDYEKMRTLLEYKGIDLQPKLELNRRKTPTLASLLVEEMTKYIRFKSNKYFRKFKALIPANYFKLLVNLKNADGNTLLHIAASNGCTDLVDELIAAGGDPTIKDNNNHDTNENLSFSLIYKIRSKEYDEIVKIFKFREINIFVKTKFDGTVALALINELNGSLKENRLEDYYKLITLIPPHHFKGLINITDSTGATLLHWAAYLGQPEIFDMLLTAGGDINIKYQYILEGVTSLHIGIVKQIRKKNYTNAKNLLEHKGVDIHKTFSCKEGQTFTVATEIVREMSTYLQANNLEAFIQLKSIIAPDDFKSLVKMENIDGNTMLHHAAYRGHIGIVKLLVEAGADLKLKSRYNYNGLENLSLSLIPLVREKRYEEILPFLEFKDLDLNIESNEISAASLLFKQIVEYIKTNNMLELNRISGVLQKKYLAPVLDKVLSSGINILQLAHLQGHEPVLNWLTEFGPDIHTSVDIVEKFKNLPAIAFVAAVERKLPETPTLYTNKERKNERLSRFLPSKTGYYSEYKNGDKLFQKQLLDLFDLFSQWGKEEKCNSATLLEAIKDIKQQLFKKGYADMQPPLYFETLKLNLEAILIMLKDPQIPLNKRTAAYEKLCANFGVCSPGLATHISDTYNTLNPKMSIDHWLADLRTSIIRNYADIHNVENHIEPGNSIHTFISFSTFASDRKWAPLYASNTIVDPFRTHSEIKDIDYKLFNLYFMKEYTADNIHACIKVNIEEILIKAFNELGLDYLAWNKDGYPTLTGKLESIFNNFGIKITTEEYFTFRNNYTEFKLNTSFIINKLCEKYIPKTLFFDSIKNQYCDLIPKSWSNLQDEKGFDFKIWEQIPSIEFNAIFTDIIKLVPDVFLKTFILNMPHYNLINLVYQPHDFNQFLESQSEGERAQISQFLLDRVDLNQRNESGNTVLHEAVEKDNLSLIEALLEQKLDLNAINTRGETALDIAIRSGRNEIISALLKYEPTLASTARLDTGWTPLHVAAFYNQTPAIDALAEIKVDLNLESKVGDTPLMLAVLKNNFEAIKLLVAAGADINKEHYTGKITALDQAIGFKNFAMIKLLIECHAVLPDNKELSSTKIYDDQISLVVKLHQLRVFAKTNHLDTFEKNLALLIDISEKREDFSVAANQMLFLAIRTGSALLVKQVIKLGFNVQTAVNNDQNTLLMSAIENGQYQLAEILIPHSNLLKINVLTQSVVDLALEKNKLGLVCQLLQRGALITRPVKYFNYIKQFNKNDPHVMIIASILFGQATLDLLNASSDMRIRIERFQKDILKYLAVDHTPSVKSIFNKSKQNTEQKELGFPSNKKRFNR